MTTRVYIAGIEREKRYITFLPLRMGLSFSAITRHTACLAFFYFFSPKSGTTAESHIVAYDSRGNLWADQRAARFLNFPQSFFFLWRTWRRWNATQIIILLLTIFFHYAMFTWSQCALEMFDCPCSVVKTNRQSSTGVRRFDPFPRVGNTSMHAGAAVACQTAKTTDRRTTHKKDTIIFNAYRVANKIF